MENPPASVTIFYLEMRDPRALRPKDPPADFDVDIVTPPAPELNRRFYCDVGSQWKWTGRLSWTDNEWRQYIDREAVITGIGRLRDRPVGYFELESQGGGNVQIAYFGLLPEFIGQGLGGALLSAAIGCAWKVPGTRRVWVHTCTDDHPHALGNYRKRGFEVFDTECE